MLEISISELSFWIKESKVGSPVSWTELSEDFDYVRVDLYEVERKIYFGELTFTDGSGYDILQPDKYDVEWGTYWK